MADDLRHLIEWTRDLHAANVRALRRTCIQGSEGDIEPYAEQLADFCERFGLEVPEGAEANYRRKEPHPRG